MRAALAESVPQVHGLRVYAGLHRRSGLQYRHPAGNKELGRQGRICDRVRQRCAYFAGSRRAAKCDGRPGAYAGADQPAHPR